MVTGLASPLLGGKLAESTARQPELGPQSLISKTFLNGRQSLDLSFLFYDRCWYRDVPDLRVAPWRCRLIQMTGSPVITLSRNPCILDQRSGA